MNEDLTPHMQQRVQFLHRYASALERGDIDAVAAVLHEAEGDHVLDRIILEMNAVYQDEDHIALDLADVAQVHNLLFNLLLSQGTTGKATVQALSLRRNIPFLPQRRKGTKERAQQDMKIQPELSPSFPENRDTPTGLSTRPHRWRVLVQTLAAVIVVAALLGSFLILFAALHTGTGHQGSSNASWSIVKSPNPLPGRHILSAVAAISTHDAWAVGDSKAAGIGSPFQALIEHWNGASWNVVKSPNPGSDVNILRGVTAISANDVWAVGSYISGGISGPTRTLIEHWNGASWSVVESPSPGAHGNALGGVSAISANDVWAVGGSDTFQGQNDVSQTLIEHWNGRNWSVVQSPNLGKGDALRGVSAISANDVWTVGFNAGSSDTSTQVLIEHWNGVRWSLVTSPGPGESGGLSGVSAISANDVWAVGYTSVLQRTAGGKSNTVWKPLIEHWNGRSWSVVQSPLLTDGGILSGAAAALANYVWAVGNVGNGAVPLNEKTLTELYH